MSKSKKKIKKKELRSFESAKTGRLTADWLNAGDTTQDTELRGDLRTLRARSRQMIRDNPHALNLRRMIQNNVVGQGIGIQCQVQTKDGKPDQKTNDLIEAAWYEWCEADNCHAAGRLNMTEVNHRLGLPGR